MKRYNLKYSYLLATVLIFLIGCDKKDVREYQKQISKVKPLELKSILEISRLHPNFENIEDKQGYLKQALDYNGNITDEAMDSEFRLSFYVKVDKITKDGIPVESNEKKQIYYAILTPCDLSIKYKKYTDYPIHSYAFHNSDVVNFKIEDLEEIGYISKNRSEQKDLCFFEQIETSGWGWQNNTSSNKLIYTAQEINEIMDEYEALR